jgi:hypothetical protein
MRSVALREACGVVRGPVREGGHRECRAPEIRAKAMEAAKSLEAQP